METINKKKIRICLVCNLSEDQTLFSHKTRKKCNKCNSRASNQKILERDPSYFRTKMKQHYDKNYKKKK
jgi:hypothetical protein